MATDNQRVGADLDNGKRSIEILHHFQCKFCNKWWTIGDAPASKTEWHCPWCGKRNMFDKISKGV